MNVAERRPDAGLRAWQSQRLLRSLREIAVQKFEEWEENGQQLNYIIGSTITCNRAGSEKREVMDVQEV